MAGLLVPRTYLVSRYLGTALIIKVLLKLDPGRLLLKNSLQHEYERKNLQLKR